MPRKRKAVPDLPSSEYFGQPTIIRLYKGDYKKYSFPTLPNRRYQVVIDASFVHKRTGRSYRFGKTTGANARSDFCCSYAYSKFDYFKQLEEAIDYGFGRAAQDDEYAAGDSGEWTENLWSQWKMTKVYAIFVIIWRTLKKTPEGKKRKVRPVVLHPKRKPTAAQLEKKYPTPKKYIRAQKRLHKKVEAQQIRAFARERNHSVVYW